MISFLYIVTPFLGADAVLKDSPITKSASASWKNESRPKVGVLATTCGRRESPWSLSGRRASTSRADCRARGEPCRPSSMPAAGATRWMPRSRPIRQFSSRLAAAAGRRDAAASHARSCLSRIDPRRSPPRPGEFDAASFSSFASPFCAYPAFQCVTVAWQASTPSIIAVE